MQELFLESLYSIHMEKHIAYHQTDYIIHFLIFLKNLYNIVQKLSLMIDICHHKL